MNNIRHYRERLNLSMEQAARAAGWSSRSTWQGYEIGRRTPNISRIKAICRVLSGRCNGKITFEKIYGCCNDPE